MTLHIIKVTLMGESKMSTHVDYNDNQNDKLISLVDSIIIGINECAGQQCYNSSIDSFHSEKSNPSTKQFHFQYDSLHNFPNCMHRTC